MNKFILTVLLGFLSLHAGATIYTVNSTSDVSTGSGTSGTLRWCITQANASSGKDTINFSLGSAGPYTITITSNLPVIVYPVFINGFSQTNSLAMPLGTGTRVMKIILYGPGDGSVYGLDITASNCEICGLVLQNFFKGIYLDGGDNNWIWGNYIGTSSDGLSISNNTSAALSSSCYDDGIDLENNANYNIIGTNGDGTNDANEGNLIAGNGDGGVQFLGECITLNEAGSITNDCTGNRIAGNYLGTNETGTAALYFNPTASLQRGSGVQINYSTANIIGTNGDGISDTYERNIISGNSDNGILLWGATGNKIKGNYIGTTKTGLVGLPNYVDGGANIAAVAITLRTGSNNNYIGTDGDGVNDNLEGNVIGSATITAGSANSYNYGIVITSTSTGNRVAGNYVGIGSDGITPLNFVTTGGSYIEKAIYVRNSSNTNIIGTNGDGVSDAYEANYIGNAGSGITLELVANCVVAGNYIGLGSNLTTTEPLSSSGTYILNSTSCRIGSSASNILERNYYCNSDYDGVWIDGGGTANTDANTIRYNNFGIRPDGVAAANAYHAIEIYKLSNGNTIQDNIITQNGTITPSGTYSAVLIGGINSGEEASDNLIYQNQIYKNIGRGIDILNVNTVKSSLGLRNKISQNSIYNNGNASNSTASTPSFGKYSLGIDLDYDGTTTNDNLDADNGPNDMLNFPVITGTSSTGTGCTSATISGTYSGLKGCTYTIELFSSDVCNGDTSGVDYYSTVYNYGEGRTYIGSTTVTTASSGGSAGTGTWTSSLPLTISGKYITAVAIQASVSSNGNSNIGNTSEFSQCYPIAFDAGDAPDTYHTLLSNCGPTHFGVGATNLKIGSTVTADGDGQPSAAANLDTDDGITSLPALNVKSTSYTLLNIPVTNTTGSTATLYAWIDFNRDGLFNSTEYASATVANNATTATLTWNFTPTCGTNIVAGVSYLRMRLTTDALTNSAASTAADDRSYGRASNGEVEDYKLYISGYDYGDLSATYPVASALCLEDTATAKVWAGVTRPTTECTQNFSVDATGDGPEEDGLTTAIGAQGGSYNWVIRLNANQANKTVYYGLWIDWDGNGNFTSGMDAFYSGSAVVNGLTLKNVSVATPYGPGMAIFRLIVSDAPLTFTMYNATITNGEVEDWTLLRILNSPGNILMGSTQSAGNLLKWKNTSALAVNKYIIERSSDNIVWGPLGTVLHMQTDNAATQYLYSDIHPLKDNYYRLKIVFDDSNFQYSNTILLTDKKAVTPITVYPNPVVNTLNIETTEANYARLKIFDLIGRLELRQEINSVNTKIDVSSLSPGTHLIKLIKQTGEEEIKRFVKIR